MKRPNTDRRKLYFAAALVSFLVGTFLAVHAVYGEHGYLALRRERQQDEALQRQIQQLQQENQRLESEIQALKSNPRAIEKLARERLHLARPNEIIFTIPDSAKRTDSSAAEASPPSH